MRTNSGQGQDGGAAAKMNKAATSATDSKNDMKKVKSKGTQMLQVGPRSKRRRNTAQVSRLLAVCW